MNNRNIFGYEIDFLYALMVTITVETIVIYILLYYFNREKIVAKNILLVGVLPSFATLPYLWFIFPIFMIKDYSSYLIIGELFVTLTETFIIKGILQITLKKALFYSTIANICSYSLSIFL